MKPDALQSRASWLLQIVPALLVLGLLRAYEVAADIFPSLDARPFNAQCQADLVQEGANRA